MMTAALLRITGAIAASLGSACTALPPSPEGLKSACEGLGAQAVAATAIGLPTSGAKVRSASWVAAAGATSTGTTHAPATPEFCKLVGSIASVDPSAASINFQLNLPLTWNGKAVQYGGGGYNGTLVTGLAPLRDAAPDDPLPLMRGYATFGTDSGHQASAFPPNAIGQFGLNDEMLTNYAYASYKKVRDVAVVLMRSLYGKAPNRLYYFGGSEGGREGLTMAQRFPADYDGVVSIVPVVQLSMLFQSYLPRQVPQFNGGWMSPAKVATLASFVAQACDALDGLSDGVVSNYLACPAHVNLQGLRCAGGGDIGDTCLSDAQIATVRAVHSEYPFAFPLANGLASYPPSLYGNETTPEPANATMVRWVTGTSAPTQAVDAVTASQQWLYGANFVRFFIAKDPGFDVRTYDPANFKRRVQQVSELIDSSNPDLSAFFARGGKLILRENMADLAQSPLAGINYFNSVVAKLGAVTVDRSARLYVSPGSTHSGNATSVTTAAAVPTMVDLLDPLDEWVSSGTPPREPLVQTVKASAPPFAVRASRPLCRYPDYPHYRAGDAARASSYTCTPP